LQKGRSSVFFFIKPLTSAALIAHSITVANHPTSLRLQQAKGASSSAALLLIRKASYAADFRRKLAPKKICSSVTLR